MAKLTVQQIKDRAKAVVAESPGGIRFTALAERIRKESPDTPENTIYGTIWNLDKAFPKDIAKPSRICWVSLARGGSYPRR